MDAERPRLGYDPRVTRRLFLLSLLLCAIAASATSLARAADPEVLVILWFDTEDYLLPASDDAAKRVAEILTSRGIRGTFKVVGEKARVLERRSRTDVIQALKRHDIGYHSNLHSVHPTPSEYLADAGWLDGAAEFTRRERAGAADVRRIFGVPGLSCYGQPGSSWAPQVIAALPQIGVVNADGVSAYVDEASHVGMDEKPFWYVNVLHVFNMGRNNTRMDLHAAGGLEKGEADFKAAYDRLRAEGGGILSIYYHPAEWVHQEFWDAVNFSRGANPPREQWKAPPQRPASETDAAFARFERYIDFQRALPGVRFVTASDLSRSYKNRIHADGADLQTIMEIARSLASGAPVDVLRDGRGRQISPAEQFSIVTAFLARAIVDRGVPERVDVADVFGPLEAPSAVGASDLPWPAFRDAVLDVADHLRARGQMPSTVFAGTLRIAPADFLIAAAAVVGEVTKEGARPMAGQLQFPSRVAIPRGTALATERFIGKDSPALFDWPIHVEGFHAPRIMELARLQAWTLKPADRANAVN